jgi:alpha-L-fucosidase
MDWTDPASVAWFNDARFGLFIHYGPYSVGGRGEWVLNREQIPKDEYVRDFVDPFRAEQYDPQRFVELAQAAGMKYVVLTARHHDGFCLWDTQTTDFNAVQMGPKADLVRPFVEAVRDAGLKVGLYHCGGDWYHPDYSGPFYRDFPPNGAWPSTEAMERFIAFNRRQVRELLTNYGRIDYLWFDAFFPTEMRTPELNLEAKRLQPHILLNERQGPPFDVKICEQNISPNPGELWESCATLNQHWGYHAGDTDWKSAKDILQWLITCAQSGGNLLLNVGPKADGSIPEAYWTRFREVGDWLQRNGRSIHGSDPSPFVFNATFWVTVHDNRVYLHRFHGAPGNRLCWADCANDIKAARFLATGEPIRFRKEGRFRLFLEDLPDPLPDAPVTTIELELEGDPIPYTGPDDAAAATRQVDTF